MKTNKELREAETNLLVNQILEMRFGDGTGQDLQIKLATKELVEIFDQALKAKEQEVAGRIREKLDSVIYNSKIEVRGDEPHLDAYISGKNEMITWYTKRLNQIKSTLKKGKQ